MALIERLETSRYAYPSPTVWADDGYEAMEKFRTVGWVPEPGWGADGWDLGDWPLVLVCLRRSSVPETSFDVLYYVEGDITIDRYTTWEEQIRRVDELALFHWLARGEEWVQEWALETGATMSEYDVESAPEHLRGPYRRRRRVTPDGPETTEEGGLVGQQPY